MRKISSDSDDVFTSPNPGPGYVTVCSKTSNKSNGKCVLHYENSWFGHFTLHTVIQTLPSRPWPMSWSDVLCWSVNAKNQQVHHRIITITIISRTISDTLQSPTMISYDRRRPMTKLSRA